MVMNVRVLALGLLASAGFVESAVAQTAATPAPAPAAEAPAVTLELNRLETNDKACRTYLMLKNASAESYGSLKLDLFVLDRGGVVAKRLAVEAAPLPARKTVIKTFDFADLGCERIGTVLLNGVLACQVGGKEQSDCVDHVATASRDPAVALIK